MEEADLLLEQSRSIELMRRELQRELEDLLKRHALRSDAMTADVSIVVNGGCQPRFHLAITILPALGVELPERKLAEELAARFAEAPRGALIEFLALNGVGADILSVEGESHGESNPTS